jgi:hypothetical protein
MIEVRGIAVMISQRAFAGRQLRIRELSDQPEVEQ